MDKYSPEERSELMSKVKSRDTSIERKVSALLDGAGYRYRRNDESLPGTPDFVVLGDANVVVFAHGCFWHGHWCRKGRLPDTGDETKDAFWFSKIQDNRRRDARVASRLRRAGYAVITIWECELKKPDALLYRIGEGIRRKSSAK